jgi:hypothetical protein
VRRFDRQTGVGGHRGSVERKKAQADGPKYVLQGSAAAAHLADISGASIPAVSFVITASKSAGSF